MDKKQTIDTIAKVNEMTKSKTISPRISPKIKEFLLSLGGTANGGAEYLIETVTETADQHIPKAFKDPILGIDYAVKAFGTFYRAALVRIKGIFNESELSLILDVMNGVYLTPQIAGQQIISNIADGMALDGLDEKWAVDSEDIMVKLVKLSDLELAALEIWCRALWEHWDASKDDAFQSYILQLI